MVNTAQNLDQRRFTGAVFTQKRVNLAGTQFKINALQRMDTGEALVNSLHLQQKLFFHAVQLLFD